MTSCRIGCNVTLTEYCEKSYHETISGLSPMLYIGTFMFSLRSFYFNFSWSLKTVITTLITRLRSYCFTRKLSVTMIDNITKNEK
jgi:hypothetical protein